MWRKIALCFLTGGLLLVPLGGTGAFSQEDKAAANRAKRIAVGDQAPKFRLKDQNGKDRTLEDLLKKSNVALVFYRSANW